ncbi:DUF799 domain-containing protein [Ferrimonas balearica]|uniref:DUF799 domain-containing protein n=1 Tax=Ferrimonas balearica TaxID=44012 RepID=UPI001C5BA530|nr:GNA1162 family protein [Ferrimonas balearica]MBW3166099.1 DUF799 domain-containing protein [Ferrimonas balearica]
MRWIKSLCPLLLVILGGCAMQPTQTLDTSAFQSEAPRSILVLPPVNHSVDVDAPGYFLSTISRPLAERGYYVFPVNTVKMIMEGEGISEPAEMHALPTQHYQALFGADAVLYVTINKWDSQYVLLSTTTIVEFEYKILSAHTGEVLWQTVKQMTYSPNGGSTGDPLADLMASAITAAIERAAPNYIPLTQQANNDVISGPYTAIPTGPYKPVKAAKN